MVPEKLYPSTRIPTDKRVDDLHAGQRINLLMIVHPDDITYLHDEQPVGNNEIWTNADTLQNSFENV